jgi:3-oxoacyl-[acyl-carrier protein] reductase
MNTDLTGMNAIVCGSTQGIGLATAIELAELGANLTLIARNLSRLKAAVHSLPKRSEQEHKYVVADFADVTSLKLAIEEYFAFNSSVHILINNTGGPKGGPIADATTAEFESVFSQHLICSHLLTQHCLPSMIRQGYGRIINIISISVKQPIQRLGVSNTVRWAVASWAKTLSLEVGLHGITVNNVLPGYTETARLNEFIEMNAASTNRSRLQVEQELLLQIPSRHFVTAQEVASVVAFLSSPAARSVNGVNIPVDGGLTRSL